MPTQRIDAWNGSGGGSILALVGIEQVPNTRADAIGAPDDGRRVRPGRGERLPMSNRAKPCGEPCDMG